MALDIETAQGAMTGASYIASLQDNREVWLDGAKVADVTGHPAMAGMVRELARIYDLQHSDAYREQMTFISPDTGNRCSLSWLLPRSHDDLKAQRRNSEIWKRRILGAVGPQPGYSGPPTSSALYAIRDALGQVAEPALRLWREHHQLLSLLHGERPVPDPRPGRPAS